MSWNYRVIKTTHTLPGQEPEDYYAIHEVYYREDNDDHPLYHTVNAAGVGGESIEGLAWVLGMMRAALEKPVMTDADFPEMHPALGADTEGGHD